MNYIENNASKKMKKVKNETYLAHNSKFLWTLLYFAFLLDNILVDLIFPSK